MPRVSKEISEIAEKNSATMVKCPNFTVWAHRHLANRERLDEYRKAFELVHKGAEDDEANTGA
jgi:hypothetical protein